MLWQRFLVGSNKSREDAKAVPMVLTDSEHPAKRCKCKAKAFILFIKWKHDKNDFSACESFLILYSVPASLTQ